MDVLKLDLNQIFKLAVQHHQAGRKDQAEGLYRQMLAQNPNDPNALQLMGTLALESGHAEEAVDMIGRALKAFPKAAEIHSNMGLALRSLGRNDEAIAEFEMAISLKPQLPEVYGNLGSAFMAQGRLEEGMAMCRKTLSMKGDVPEAHVNLAIMLLLRGEWKEAWPHFEWRWARHLKRIRPNFIQPEWDGGDLHGRMILLRAEQGYGDSIQCIRFAKLVANRGGRVIVACPEGVVKLLRNVEGVGQLLDDRDTLPLFDVWCSMLSLPRVMGTTLETIPGGVPYLKADQGLAAKWASRMGERKGVKVGLVWAGRPQHVNDRNRSISLKAMAPLAKVPGVSLYSLQKDEAREQLKSAPEGMELVDWTEELQEFTDTAALIENLDMVITVDTAVAHLAGAMGKTVWLLLPFVPDWRWLLEREDSPWYPTMRLFRQKRGGDWESVIGQVAEELAALAK